MAAPTSDAWPEFQLVGIEILESVPLAVREELGRRGVPAGLIGQEYRALPVTEIVSASGGEAVVAFGSWGLHGRVCLDSASGTVVTIAAPGATDTTVVNASLTHFIDCVAAIIARFPFYDESADFDDWEAAGDEITAILESMDDRALGLNSFWETFVDDVKIGDYSTDVVAHDNGTTS